MEGSISAFEAQRCFDGVLKDVLASGESFVVERHGEPVAAVVPIKVYEQWKRGRGAFFSRIRAASERADMSPNEAQILAEEAVRGVRSTPKI